MSGVLHALAFAALFLVTPPIPPESIAQVYSVTLLESMPSAIPEEPGPLEPPEKPATTPPPSVDVPSREEPLPIAEPQPPEEKKKHLCEAPLPSTCAPPSTDQIEQQGVSNYWHEVRARVATQMKYPTPARRLRQEGYVALRLTLDAQGQPLEVTLLDMSDDSFARSAVEAVWKAAPFPPPSNGLPDHPVAVIPVQFKIDQPKEKKERTL